MSHLSDIKKFKNDRECSELQVEHDYQVQKTLSNLKKTFLYTDNKLCHW